MKVFVINLEKSVDRRLFMDSQLQDLGLDYEFVSAVDGRKLTNDGYEKHCDMQKVKNHPDLLTPGMIGCSLSHYTVYRQMVDREIQCALILEDDTLLGSEINKLLLKVEELFKDNLLDKHEPILFFFQGQGQVCPFTKSNQIPIHGNYTINYPVNLWQPITTAAYVITYECAKRLANFVYPVRCSPDSWGVFHREKVIKGIRCMLPVPVESGYFKSDIGYQLNSPLNNFVKMLETKNVFPIRQLLKNRRRRRAKMLHGYSLVDDACNWTRNEFN